MRASKLALFVAVLATLLGATNLSPIQPAAMAATVGAPVNSALPQVSGTTTISSTLRTTAGTWSASPTSYKYYWQRCDSAGANCSNISGATTTSYRVTSSDTNKRLRTAVTAANTKGSATAYSITTPVVVSAKPAVTVAPTITGTLAVNSTLTATQGNWSNFPTSYSYQWQRCDPVSTSCTNISGATKSAYTAIATDRGNRLKVIVTASNAVGSTAGSSVISNQVAPYLRNTALPAVSAAPKVGVSSTATAGAWTVASPSLAYAWQRCDSAGANCIAINGATSSTYVPVNADMNLTLRVKVTAVSSDESASATSNASTAVAAPTAPSNIELPVVSGANEVGGTLSATTGGWAGSPTGYAYAWERCDTNGNGCVIIASATAGTFVITRSEINARLRVSVTATNAGGSANAKSVAMAAIKDPDVLTNTVPPSVSGIAAVSQSLSATTGAWSQTPDSFTYAWLRCDATGNGCIAISGATSATYVLVDADKVSTIKVSVTALKGGLAATSASAATTAIAGRPAPVNSTPPSIAGQLNVASTLTATNGTWSGEPTSFAFQWQRCGSSGATCTPITEATGATLLVTPELVSERLRLEVSATNGTGTTKAISVVSDAIKPAAPVNTVLPSIAGESTEGAVVTATNGTWSNNPTSYSYVWLRCDIAGNNCAAIAGINSISYTLQTADRNSRIAVAVTAVNAGGSATATSVNGNLVTAAGPPELIDSPSISGTPEVDLPITGWTGTWRRSPTSYAYEWQRCDRVTLNCAAIAGATGSVYTVKPEDSNSYMRVKVTAKNSSGSATALSPMTTAVMVSRVTFPMYQMSIIDGGMSNSNVIQMSKNGRFILWSFMAPDTEDYVTVYALTDNTAGTTKILDLAAGLPSELVENMAGAAIGMSEDGRYVLTVGYKSELRHYSNDDPYEVLQHEPLVFDTTTGRSERLLQSDGWPMGLVPMAISGNGRFVFGSGDPVDFGLDPSSTQEIFRYDRQTKAVALVSQRGPVPYATDASQIMENVDSLSVSNDGNIVVFSYSTRWYTAAGVSSDAAFLNIRNIAAGTTKQITATPADKFSNDTKCLWVNDSRLAPGDALSGDGRYVAFTSCRRLTADDTNDYIDAYLYDSQSSTMRRVSTPVRPTSPGGELDEFAVISGDGKYVAFSKRSLLVEADRDAVLGFGGEGYYPSFGQRSAVFVTDWATGKLEVSDTGMDGRPSYGRPYVHAISNGGRFLLFESNATNISEGGDPWATPIRLNDGTKWEDRKLQAQRMSSGDTIYLVDRNYKIEPTSVFGHDAYGPMDLDVNLALGNYTRNSVDADATTVGPELAVQRNYNSLDRRVGPFGIGWSFNYGMTWQRDAATGYVYITYPDGRVETHVPQNNGFTQPFGYASSLKSDGAGGYTLTQKDKTVYAFSSSGKLVKITDAAGISVQLSYDGSGQLTSARNDTTGNAVDFTWSGGRITSASSISGTWNYSYTANTLAKVCEPGNSCWTFIYDANGVMTKVVKPKGNTEVTLTYDAAGKVTSRTDGVGAKTTYAYPRAGVISITDARGNVSTSEYDARFRLISETKPGGATTRYEYSSAGFRSKVVDANGTETKLEYDNTGNLVAQTDGEGHTTYMTYVDGRVTDVRDSRSSGKDDNRFKASFTYDSAGNLLTETLPATDQFPNGVTRSYTYSTGKEFIPGAGTMAKGLLRSSTDENGATTTYNYDPWARMTEVVTPTGMRTVNGYNQQGQISLKTEYSDSFPDGVTSTYEYDANGRPSVVTSPVTASGTNGQYRQLRTTVTYDANDNKLLVSAIDVISGGPARESKFAYDDADREISATDPEGGVIKRTYDSVGNIISVTDQLGRVSMSAYDASNRPTVLTTNGVVVGRYTYDAAGRKLSQQDALGRIVTFSYDRNDRLRTSTLLGYRNVDGTAADVQLVAYDYDNVGNVVLETTGGTTRVAKTYDAMGRLASETADPGGLNRITTYRRNAGGAVVQQALSDAERVETTSFAYDLAGRLVSKTIENGDADAITTYTYDNRGVVKSVTDANGGLTEYTTDALGRVRSIKYPLVMGYVQPQFPTEEFDYNAFGEQTASEDARGNITFASYDRLGRQLTTEYPTVDNFSPVQRYSYDKVGNLVSSSDRRGQVTNFEFDAFNRVVKQLDPTVNGSRPTTTFEYDLAGNRTVTVDPIGARTEWTYDGLDRVRTATDVVRQPTTARFTQTFGYDTNGNQNYTQDALGAVTKMEYSPLGELTKLTDATNAVTTYTYDVASRVRTQTDALGRRSISTYDLAGNQISETAQDRSGVTLTTEQWTYDKVGRVLVNTSPRGSKTINTWDDMGRLTSVTDPLGAKTQYEYEITGEPHRITDAIGNATRIQNNAWGLSTATIEPRTSRYPNDADSTYSTSYDAGGLAVKQTQPGDVVVNRTFDSLGRLTSEAGSGGGATTASRSFEYDAVGRQTKASTPTGAITFEYDDRGLLTAARGSAGTSTFAYDGNGQMTSRTDAAGTTSFTWNNRGDLATATDTSGKRTYGWDAADRLTSVGYGNGTARTYGYDELDRLTSDVLKKSTTQLASHGYSYDADSNVTGQSINITGNPKNGNYTYSYDAAGHIASMTVPGGAKTDYAYDANGNRTRAGTATYSYDERNRPTTNTYTARGTLSSSAGTNYTFDALDQMTSAGTVGYTYDALSRIASRNGTAFSYAGGELDPVADGSTTYSRSPSGDLLSVGTSVAYRNQHGDLEGLVNSTGAIAGSRIYDPYGQVLGTAGTIVGNAGYQSDYTDPTTAKVWMGARWYDASTASFVSRDTFGGLLGNPISLNRYTYAYADPLSYFDPDGHSPDGVKQWVSDRASDVVNAGRSLVNSVQSGYRSVRSSVSHAVTATSHAMRSVYATSARVVGQVAKVTIGVAKVPVRLAKTSVNATTRCMSSSSCRTTAAVVAGGVMCVAASAVCATSMLVGAAVGSGIGAATCGASQSTKSCITRGAVVGAAGGMLGFATGGAGAAMTARGSLALLRSEALSGFGGSAADQLYDGKFSARGLMLGAATGAASAGAGQYIRALRSGGSSSVGVAAAPQSVSPEEIVASLKTNLGHIQARGEGVRSVNNAGEQSTQQTTRRSGRGKNKLTANPTAVGPHVTFRRNENGEIIHYQEWELNPMHPLGFDPGIRFDRYGKSHTNKLTQEYVATPHINGPNVPGGVRPARPEEIPGGKQ